MSETNLPTWPMAGGDVTGVYDLAAINAVVRRELQAGFESGEVGPQVRAARRQRLLWGIRDALVELGATPVAPDPFAGAPAPVAVPASDDSRGAADGEDGAPDSRPCPCGGTMYRWDPTVPYPDRTEDTAVRWRCPACKREERLGAGWVVSVDTEAAVRTAIAPAPEPKTIDIDGGWSVRMAPGDIRIVGPDGGIKARYRTPELLAVAFAVMLAESWQWHGKAPAADPDLAAVRNDFEAMVQSARLAICTPFEEACSVEEIARTALEAAGVPALLAVLARVEARERGTREALAALLRVVDGEETGGAREVADAYNAARRALASPDPRPEGR